MTHMRAIEMDTGATIISVSKDTGTVLAAAPVAAAAAPKGRLAIEGSEARPPLKGAAPKDCAKVGAGRARTCRHAIHTHTHTHTHTYTHTQ